jgi:hypothetical protein
MPTDDGWEDIAQDDDGWEDIPAAAAPKPSAFASLRGSKIEAEPSWWEKVKGFSSGFGKNLTSLGVRAVDAVANSNLSAVPNIDPLGRINNAERLRKIEEALGVTAPQDGERVAPGERTGRAVAAMVPQVGVGLASAGQSIPMQALIAGASQSGQSLLEGLSPQEALTAGATSAGFAGLGGGVSRLMAPAGGAVRPGVVQAGERLGLDLPASVKTGSRAVQYLEGLAGKVPGGQRIVDRATRATDDMRQIGAGAIKNSDATAAGNKLAQEVSGLEDYARRAEEVKAALTSDAKNLATRQQRAADVGAAQEQASKIRSLTMDEARKNEIGKAIGKSRGERYSDFVTTKNALYDKADLTGITAEMKTIRDFAEDYLARGGGDPQDIVAVRSLLQKTTPKTSIVDDIGPLGERTQRQVVDPIAAADVRTLIQGLSRGRGTPDIVFKSPALRRKLVTMMQDDLATATGGTSAGEALGVANKFYAQGVKQFETQGSKRVGNLSKQGQFSKIPDTLFRPDMAVEDIPRYLDMAGPQARPEIQAAVMSSIASAKNPAAALQAWRGKLAAILEPDQIAQLEDVANPAVVGRIEPLPIPPVTATEAPSAARALKDSLRRTIATNAGSPETIVRRVMSADTSPSDAARLLAMAGDSADQIRNNVFAQVMEGATNKAGEFTPQGAAGVIKRWGPKLKAILTPEQWQQLQDLSTVSGASGEMARISKSSPTAGLLQWGLPAAGLGASVGEGDATPFARSVASLAALYGGARFIGSPLGQKWLTSGIPGARAAGTGVGLTGRAATAGIGSAVADERRKRGIRRSTTSRRP